MHLPLSRFDGEFDDNIVPQKVYDNVLEPDTNIGSHGTNPGEAPPGLTTLRMFPKETLFGSVAATSVMINDGVHSEEFVKQVSLLPRSAGRRRSTTVDENGVRHVLVFHPIEILHWICYLFIMILNLAAGNRTSKLISFSYIHCWTTSLFAVLLSIPHIRDLLGRASVKCGIPSVRPRVSPWVQRRLDCYMIISVVLFSIQAPAFLTSMISYKSRETMPLVSARHTTYSTDVSNDVVTMNTISSIIECPLLFPNYTMEEKLNYLEFEVTTIQSRLQQIDVDIAETIHYHTFGFKAVSLVRKLYVETKIGQGYYTGASQFSRWIDDYSPLEKQHQHSRSARGGRHIDYLRKFCQYTAKFYGSSIWSATYIFNLYRVTKGNEIHFPTFMRTVKDILDMTRQLRDLTEASAISQGYEWDDGILREPRSQVLASHGISPDLQTYRALARICSALTLHYELQQAWGLDLYRRHYQSLAEAIIPSFG